jgi:hypothetical protein
MLQVLYVLQVIIYNADACTHIYTYRFVRTYIQITQIHGAIRNIVLFQIFTSIEGVRANHVEQPRNCAKKTLDQYIYRYRYKPFIS